MSGASSLRSALLGGSALVDIGALRAWSRAARPARVFGAAAMLALAWPAHAQTAPALPAGGVFVAGTGSIQSSATTMSISQTTSRGVIDWREFSIGAANQVQIDNAAGATLNRVMSGQLSRIEGMLSATGSVYLMNPAGVIVGPGGRVTTGGDFVASTRQIDPAAFMAGGALAIAGGSNGAIANEGSVVSQRGSVVMIAREVTNHGSITASNGRVTLAAADEVLLATTDGKADGIYVSIGSGGGDVTQAGRIEAAAVALQAADGNIFALAGNRDGLVRATGTATIEGELWLTAQRGRVEVAQTLVATNADGGGGRVAVNGRDVTLAATADISAAGTRGGEVLVGTNGFATGNDLAERTTIADGARISAGGPEGGGLIETSGETLDLGSATILAGAGGTWLIDPSDITIDAPAAAALVASLDAGGGTTAVETASGTGGSGDITVAAPIVWTGTGNLAFYADRDLAINEIISGGGGTLEMNVGGDLGINAAVSATQVSAFVTGTLTIGAAGAVGSAGAIALETGVFINQGGAAAVSSSGDNWYIASDAADNDSDGGLASDYYAYDYDNLSGVPAPGNGRFYRTAPSVSFTLGPVVKDYDGTTDATLDGSNVTVIGLINGDTFTLDGSYATKDAGAGIDVTATNFAANRGGIPVYGYDVATPSVTDDVGTINRATLTASIVGNPTKTYNATTAVALTSANFALAGLVGSETITVNSAAAAAYASADAGIRVVNATFATPSFTAASGTLLTNYNLPTTATGLGTIDAASLIVSGVTANDKVYDATAAATLNTGGASIFGIVPGDTVTLDSSAATGTFATKNVGTAIAVTASGFILAGADASNYVVDQVPSLAANITPAPLVVSGLTANDKVYDGTTSETLNTAGLQFTGIFAGDTVNADGASAQVNFASKNAGTDIPVTITGVTLAGTDAGNYDLSFSDTLVADILPRQLTINATGTPTKVYDGTTSAVVGAGGITLDNVVAGESVTLSQAADVQYADKNVGVWTITGTLTSADYVAGAGTLLANYLLPTSATTQGEITPAPLTIVIVQNPTKPYDGNANASLGPDNFAMSGFVAGEGAEVTQTSGQYASSDAGVWTVSADLDAGDFDPDPGTMMSNYIIPTPVYGPGTITRIPLGPGVVTVDITGNPSKIYDGNTIATLVPSDYTLGGFIAGEGATITETQGTYDSKDAGFRAVLVLLDPSDFDPDPGTNLDNYTLPTQATGVGTIFQRMLSASIIGNPSKVYNGTTRAVVAPANYDVTGEIAGESVTVAPGVVANYASEDAGIRVITANFTSSSNFTAGSGTLLANYVLPTTAQGPGTITPAPLLVLGITAQNKVYDQTTLATLAGTASLFGVVAGDTVNLLGGSAAGEFAQSDVGNGIAVAVTGYDISGADAGNYELFQPTGLNANITPRGLTIANVSALDRLYDGTTVAQLSLGGASLVGVLSGDTVNLDSGGSSASFLQKDIGTDLRVNVGGFAISGADSGNYSLSQPGGLAADINPVQLTGAILGNPTKTYDGTNSVSLSAANYQIGGFVAGEGAVVTQSAGSSYDSANAGARTVTATLVVSDITPNPGTLLSNYLLPAPLTGAGTINPAPLIAAIIGNPTKVYDATTDATLTSANYQLAGFVAGEGATVTETAGLYDQKNVGSRTVTAALGALDFTANPGTTLANYVLPTTASGAGTITPAQVQVIGVIAEDKVYDRTTTATLDSSGGSLTGVFGGDVVNLVSTGASGTFATRNVGTDIPVTAVGYTIAGTDAANYTVLQPFGLSADITEKLIALASVTKVYDADTPVPTVDSAYTLSGVIGGDSVGVDASGISGDYIDKNVGSNKAVTLTGVVLSGADAGNYSIADGVTNAPIGFITPATLNIIGVLAEDKTYDQSSTATLDNTGAALSGVLTGPLGTDDVSLDFEPPTGTFVDGSGNPTANAGTWTVRATGYTVTGADALNYALVQPQGVTATIDQLEIFLASVTKVYDGTVALPTAASGYSFTGVLSGDTVVAQTSAVTGQYNDDKNVGTLKPVTVNGLTLTGASGGNYFISSSVTDNIGIVTQATLTAAIVGNPTKTYDGNTDATLAPANYQFSGFVLSEGATVTQTAGTYDSQNVDATTVTASIGGFITPDAGTLLSNYVLPTSASGPGTIDPRLLTISGVTADDKVYDGNTDADLLDGSATLNNIVSGDTVALDTSGAVGVFDSPDVGTNIPVTASGYALLNNPFGNYILEQPTGLVADITAASLTLDEIRRIYDGTVALPTVSSAYTLGGVVTGDDVFVNAGTIAGAYADKNVGIGIPVTYTNLTLGGADAGNYLIPSSAVGALIGTIDPALIAAAIIGPPTKVYDGNTNSMLAPANYQLTGFVTGESATVTQIVGTYNSPDVLTANTVTADIDTFIVAGPGTDLANYVLPTSASGAGVITPATLTAAIINDPTKTYDGNDAATLASTNYQLSGFFLTNGATVTQTAGTYASANAGSRTVTATLAASDFTPNPGTLLSNYTLPSSASGAGTIDQALLNAAIIGNPTKVYDGNTSSLLAPANYQFTGFIGSESASVTQTAGTYNSPNVLTANTVTANIAGLIVAGSGTDLANYVLPTSASGAGTITTATLAAAIIGNPTKTYDATTAATLAPANYQLTGFIGSESATVTQSAGTYASANAGSRTVTAALTSGDFTAGGGTLLSNYTLPTSASGTGTIDPATLAVTIVGNPTKVYDGNTSATLAPANYNLTGFVGSEGATVTQTAGAYASANAGPRLVSATLATTDFTATGGTLLANYVLPTSASGLGTITQKALTASIVGIPTRTYDATTAITLAPADYALTGFVPGESATVTETSGTFASPNAGIRLITATLENTDFAPAGGTLLANYVLPTSASGPGLIERALLAASVIGNPTKVYDGNTAATLTSSNYALTGFIGGQGATVTETAGTYASADAGPRVVTVALGSADFTANVGTSLLNYVLPTSASGLGTITRATLTAAIVGNPTKTYDGDTDATLAPVNYQLTGFVGSEGATITQTSGTYALKDAGPRTIIATLADTDFSAAGGTLLSNYTLPTTASGLGTITRATLTASIVGNPTKTYDGNTDATLATANYQLTGFVGSEGATVTQASGIYGLKDAGSRTVSATLAAGDFVATGTTLLANYTLPTTASGLGTIDPATLTAAIIGNPTKTYDSTNAATLAPANYQLTGFVGSEGATVTQTAGTYASPNAGPRIVTATLGSGDFTAIGSTLLRNYTLPTTVSGLGTIGTATLTAAIIGNPTKTYDGTTAATLTSANYQLTGFIGSEGATVTETSGTYALADAGIRLVSATLDGTDFSATGSTLLSNYTLPTSASGLGTIDPATLTAAIVGNPTKTYDGTDTAMLAPANYQLTGFIAGDGATVTQTAGTYASPNAGLRLVSATLGSATFTATGSTRLANYTLPTTASGLGTIDPATLAIAIVGNPSKVYDGNTTATLAPANYSLTGFIGGDGATVTRAIGTYGLKDVGLRTVTTSLAGTDYTPTGSTLLANYVLPTSASGLGTITRATLTAAIVGNPTKVYDGNTDATLAPANYQLAGFVAGEGATVTQADGTYALKDVGLRMVTAALAGIDFTADSGTLLSNYTLPTSASGLGTIDRATLTAAIVGNPSKIYDGSDGATLTSANYQLSGFVAGEGATVTQTAGTYASPNAGLRLVSATLGSTDFTATGSTLLANYTLPTTASGLGTIDRATLTAAIVGNPSKVYDGTDVATLVPANYSLTGFIGSEGARVTRTTGSYASANAGLRVVSTTLATGDFTADSGTLLANYVLPTSASGLGTITQATLTAAIVGNPTKVYDANDAATLAPASYQLTGFVAGESAMVTQTVGTYASANAGMRLITANLVPGDFDPAVGTLLANYILPTSATGLGTIDRARLSVSIIGNPSKTYDGSTAAALSSANYQLTGFIGLQGATITQTIGSYDSANAGPRTVTAALATDDYDAHFGTLLDNYVLPTVASGAGTIDRALLAAAIVGNPTKVYDGNTDATLTAANYSLTGFIGSEGATVTQTAGTYAQADAGIRGVSAILAAGDFTANAGTLLTNYALPTSAAGFGTIDRATLAAAIIGNPTKTYDGNTDATLTSTDYQLTGFVAGEGASVTETFGTYDSADAGLRSVAATLDGSDFAADSGTLLSNYILPTSAAGLGTILPKPITARTEALIINDPTKVYDGTTVATLAPGNFLIEGFIGSDGATITQTVGAYADSNAGVKLITAALSRSDFVANLGTNLNNYLLPDEASGFGTILQAPLTATIIGNPTKTYDATAAALLGSGNYLLSGFVSGEGATVIQTAGTYDSANAGARAVTATLGGTDYIADAGTALSNYILPTGASGPGTIDPALLIAAIVGNPTKTFDGGANAMLTAENYSLTGFVAGEGATVTQTAGTYDTPNAGSRSVTASLAGSDFNAAGGTLLSNYLLPTSATGPGTITPKPIDIVIFNIITKTYDGTTAAAIDVGDVRIVGLEGTNQLSVNASIPGSYNDPAVGLHRVVIGRTDINLLAAPGTLLSNYMLLTDVIAVGQIVPKPLTATLVDVARTYDATTSVTLTPSNFSLAGFVAGEGATVTEMAGLFANPNAGQWQVSASLDPTDFVANVGTQFSNYALPTSASGIGRIDPAPLTAAIVGNPTRVYDGTTAATLTSGNFSLTGFVAGQGATVSQTAGTYDSPNAGPRIVSSILATGDFTASGGTLLSNYVLPTSATGSGTIDRANLAAAITGNPTKPFDGNTDATLGPTDYSLSGFVAGEGATITETFGIYDSPEAGPRTVTAALALSDYAPAAGTLLSNYNLPDTASGPGTIEEAPPDFCQGNPANCLPSPEVLLDFISTQPIHFYVVYPTVVPMFQGHTGAFAGIPSVVIPSSVLEVPGGIVIVNGTTLINSSEQILLFGGSSSQFTIEYPPIESVDFEGTAP